MFLVFRAAVIQAEYTRRAVIIQTDVPNRKHRLYLYLEVVVLSRYAIYGMYAEHKNEENIHAPGHLPRWQRCASGRAAWRHSRRAGRGGAEHAGADRRRAGAAGAGQSRA